MRDLADAEEAIKTLRHNISNVAKAISNEMTASGARAPAPPEPARVTEANAWH